MREMIFALSELVNGENGGDSMKKRPVDPDMPSDKAVRVKDFLPPPSEIIFPERSSKITIALTRSTIEFFKWQAAKHHTKYQKMIRELLDKYAAHYRVH